MYHIYVLFNGISIETEAELFRIIIILLFPQHSQQRLFETG